LEFKATDKILEHFLMFKWLALKYLNLKLA